MSEIVDVFEAIANPGLNVLETLYIYGSVFVSLFALYTFIRGRPSLAKLYNPRRFKGFHSFWAWGGLQVDEHVTHEQAGLDALCLLKWLEMGIKVGVVGCFCAVWLIPVYRTAIKQEGNLDILDELTMWSMGNLHNNDSRLWASVVTSYIVSIVVMALIYKDFGWYIKRRHDYLSSAQPESYTVYVGNLPPRLRSNTALTYFFRDLYGETVSDTKVAFNLGALEKNVVRRDKVLEKLEHANNVLLHRGKRPTRRASVYGGAQMDCIDTYRSALSDLNARISSEIRSLQDAHRALEAKVLAEERRRARTGSRQAADAWWSDDTSPTPAPVLVRSAGFVTFSSLTSTQSALQMLHDSAPFRLVTQVAPRPNDVFWRNVGLSQARINAGRLLSTLLTSALCLFWTIPVFFIAGLAKVDSIKGSIVSLRDTPAWLDNVLAQISPLTLILLQALLPKILLHFAKLEGHISEAELQTSLFLKLSSFQLIQIFYITALLGSILNQLQELLVTPMAALIDALGQNLPGQAPVFMTLVLVKTFLALMFELLRVMPVLTSWIRSKIGPNLTPNESSRSYLGLSPLSSPATLDHASLLSDVVLFFMISFVYSALHPVASLIMLFAFSMMLVVYKNQLMYVYESSNDTGGLFWPLVAKVLILCLLFAEITVIAVLSLKEAPVPAVLMAPLVFATVYFLYFVGQQHFRTAKFLPSTECARLDKERCASGFFYCIFAEHYAQDALKKLQVWPETVVDSHFFQKEDLKHAARALLCPPTPPGGGHPQDITLMLTHPSTPISLVTEAASVLGGQAEDAAAGKARHLADPLAPLEEITREDGGEERAALLANPATRAGMRGAVMGGSGILCTGARRLDAGGAGAGVGYDRWQVRSAGAEPSLTGSAGGGGRTAKRDAREGAQGASQNDFSIVVPVADVEIVVPLAAEAFLPEAGSSSALPQEAGAAGGKERSAGEGAALQGQGATAADFQVVVPVGDFEISIPVTPKAERSLPEEQPPIEPVLKEDAQPPELSPEEKPPPAEKTSDAPEANLEVSIPVKPEAQLPPEPSSKEKPPPVEAAADAPEANLEVSIPVATEAVLPVRGTEETPIVELVVESPAAETGSSDAVAVEAELLLEKSTPEKPPLPKESPVEPASPGAHGMAPYEPQKTLRSPEKASVPEDDQKRKAGVAQAFRQKLREPGIELAHRWV